MGAQEKTIPFCIRWVRSLFAQYPGRRRLPVGYGAVCQAFA
jgi:hypothetical protein